MMKNTIRGGYLLAPAALLALLMGGCVTPPGQTDDPALDDVDEGAAEDVADSSDALSACGGVGGVGGVGYGGVGYGYGAAGCGVGVAGCGVGCGAGAWSSWAALPGISAYSVPSLAYLGGVPYMAYIGAGNQCFLSSYANSAWAAPAVIPGCFGPAAPSLAVLGDSLYAGYLGSAGGCFLNAYGAAGWGTPYGISGCGGAWGPVLAPYSGSLALAYGGAAGGLYYGTCSGLSGWGYGAGYGCGAGALIPGIATPYAPALGVYGGTLALAYTGLSNQLFYTTLGGCGGAGGCAWATPYGIPGAYAGFGPTFGYYGNSLLLGYSSLYGGGYGFMPYTGAGWGAATFLGTPYAGVPFGFGYLGGGLGWGAFSAYNGALYGAYRTAW